MTKCSACYGLFQKWVFKFAKLVVCGILYAIVDREHLEFVRSLCPASDRLQHTYDIIFDGLKNIEYLKELVSLVDIMEFPYKESLLTALWSENLSLASLYFVVSLEDGCVSSVLVHKAVKANIGWPSRKCTQVARVYTVGRGHVGTARTLTWETPFCYPLFSLALKFYHAVYLGFIVHKISNYQSITGGKPDNESNLS